MAKFCYFWYNITMKKSLESNLHKAFRQLMRPLVSFSLKHGISVNQFYIWLKALYVDAAEDLKIEGRKQTTSRIAVLTGLDRKDVAKLRVLNQESEQLVNQSTKKINRALRAVNTWTQNPLFIDEDNNPKKLAIWGEEDSFEHLMKISGGDIPVRAVLDELLRSSTVVEVEDGYITLVQKSYIPTEEQTEQFTLMGQATEDMLSTIIHNIENKDKSRLQMSVAYTELNQYILDKLKTISEVESYKLLEKINDWFNDELNQQEKNEEVDSTKEIFNEQSIKYRAGIGIYYFQTPTKDGTKGPTQ